MVQTLTKARIASMINREIGLSREDSLAIVGEILDEMSSSLVRCGSLKISSFGIFKVIRKKERVGRNPKTLEKFVVEEHNTVTFCPSVTVKRFINGDET
ncbi:integration host factor subunit alpha [Anaplasma phagocytophilum]|nr:integration host factor subunit alpha [Anaplasma phagocytophilum]ANC34684.1 DNA-binding protein [Anaplasma phagocytophilum str. Norway variant2]EOA61496.1 integration host factor, alpha subunit [Anaplasma phagocytophilum str. HGE1]EOA62715.1 integration host factor, alpha subunit [Anaplasma phagocytophilum str. CRT38]KDB55196.1 DNA-binding protein [Anaplasma phagocytophilum str. MRK]KDB55815.1 DNA-binding protein [Anaplasma phagocytophilum str. CRT35]